MGLNLDPVVPEASSECGGAAQACDSNSNSNVTSEDSAGLLMGVGDSGVKPEGTEDVAVDGVRASEGTKPVGMVLEEFALSRGSVEGAGTVDRGSLSKSGGGSGRGGGEGEHVCRVCGAPAPSFRKLFDCRLSLGRARVEVEESPALAVEAAEGAAAAAEDALASRCEQKAVEQSLVDSIREVSLLGVTP